jgi:hypothetical protein
LRPLEPLRGGCGPIIRHVAERSLRKLVTENGVWHPACSIPSPAFASVRNFSGRSDYGWLASRGASDGLFQHADHLLYLGLAWTLHPTAYRCREFFAQDLELSPDLVLAPAETGALLSVPLRDHVLNGRSIAEHFGIGTLGQVDGA